MCATQRSSTIGVDRFKEHTTASVETEVLLLTISCTPIFEIGAITSVETAGEAEGVAVGIVDTSVGIFGSTLAGADSSSTTSIVTLGLVFCGFNSASCKSLIILTIASVILHFLHCERSMMRPVSKLMKRQDCVTLLTALRAIAEIVRERKQSLEDWLSRGTSQ